MHLCQRSGIDMALFVDAVVDSGAATVSNLFRDIGPRIAAGDDDPVFALDLLAKDNRLALRRSLRGAGLDAPVAEVVSRSTPAPSTSGTASRDSIAVVHAYRRRPA